MANFAISYGGEWEVPPVFIITAQCGHTYRVPRDPPDLTVERFVRFTGETEQCPDCLVKNLQTMADEIDYRRNPDSEPLGLSRLTDAITGDGTFIAQPDAQGDEDPDSE